MDFSHDHHVQIIWCVFDRTYAQRILVSGEIIKATYRNNFVINSARSLAASHTEKKSNESLLLRH